MLVISFLGIYTASHDLLFNKSQQEIIEMFIADANKNMSLYEIRKLGLHKLLYSSSTQFLQPLLLGGCITGSGICIMYYISMLAICFDGHIKWEPGLLAFSCLIVITTSVIAFWILFRSVSIFPDAERLRMISAVIISVGVTGVHYIECRLRPTKAAMLLPPKTKKMDQKKYLHAHSFS